MVNRRPTTVARSGDGSQVTFSNLVLGVFLKFPYLLSGVFTGLPDRSRSLLATATSATYRTSKIVQFTIALLVAEILKPTTTTVLPLTYTSLGLALMVIFPP